MNKSTQNILAIGGLGLVAWYLLSKNKSSETAAKTNTGTGTAPAQRSIPNDAANILLNTNTGVLPPKLPEDSSRKAPVSPSLVSDSKIKPMVGKYKLTGNASINITTKFNNIGRKLESNLYEFRTGDIVDAKTILWNDREKMWDIGIDVDGQKRSLPSNLVMKVDNSIPVTSPKVTVIKNDGTTPDFRAFSGKRPLTLDNLLM